MAWSLILDICKQNEGIAFCADISMPLPQNTIIICNDAAGFSEEDPDSFRGGCSVLLIPGDKFSRVSVVEWDKDQIKNHSTCLEMVNGQRPLTKLLTDPEFANSKYENILEIYDNSAVVASNIRLGASSPVIRDLIVKKTKILLGTSLKFKIYTMWRRRNRPEIAMCDDGSKGELLEMDKKLQELKLPARKFVDLPKPEFPDVEDQSS
jgi:hypothetical protein